MSICVCCRKRKGFAILHDVSITICSAVMCTDCWARRVALFESKGYHAHNVTCPVCARTLPPFSKSEEKKVIECRKANARMYGCPHSGCSSCVYMDRPETCWQYALRTIVGIGRFSVRCVRGHRATIRRAACSADYETIVSRTRPCPSCFARIERNGGCPRVTCYICKYSFCYGCLDTKDVHYGICN